MSNKDIICDQSHGSFHVFSLIGGPAPVSSEGSGWLTLLLFMGLQTPSTPSVPSSAPHHGGIQCLTASITLCICQALAEPFRRQLYQAPVSKHFLASTILCGFGDCIWDRSPGGEVSEWPSHSLCSTLCLHISSCEYFFSSF